MQKNEYLFPNIVHSVENKCMPDFYFWDNNSEEFPSWLYEMTEICEYNAKKWGFQGLDPETVLEKIDSAIWVKRTKTYDFKDWLAWLIIVAISVTSRINIDAIIKKIKDNKTNKFQVTAFLAWTQRNKALIIIFNRISNKTYIISLEEIEGYFDIKEKVY